MANSVEAWAQLYLWHRDPRTTTPLYIARLEHTVFLETRHQNSKSHFVNNSRTVTIPTLVVGNNAICQIAYKISSRPSCLVRHDSMRNIRLASVGRGDRILLLCDKLLGIGPRSRLVLGLLGLLFLLESMVIETEIESALSSTRHEPPSRLTLLFLTTLTGAGGGG